MLWLVLMACNGDGTPTPPDPTVEPGLCEDHGGEVLCDDNKLVTCDDAGGVADVIACGAEEVCDPAAEACVGCQLELIVPHADPDVAEADGIFVPLDAIGGSFEARRLTMRPLQLEGRASIEISGPFALYTDDGAPVSSGEVLGPATLLIHGTGTGTGTLSVSPESCGGDPATLSIHVADPGMDLAGTHRSGFPWFDAQELFDPQMPVTVKLDPQRYLDRVGQPFDAYLVPDRSAEEWAADGALDPVAGPVQGTVSADLSELSTQVWASPDSPDALVTAYDLVLDFGQDGTLDPGDLIDGLDGVGLYVTRDLAEPGPYTPAPRGELSLDYWHTMVFYHPEELDQLDPMPLVAISHGNGHDYTWYDYLGEHLASHGYVVMSHRNNTGPGPISASVTTWENTEAFLANLPGSALDGEVDTDRIVWVGHSRGGESVVIANHRIHTGMYNPTQFDESDLVLISSIAPTIFEGPDVANPHGIPYHLIAGSADGDVHGGPSTDLTQYYRIFLRGTSEQMVTYVQGADHNDFNCCGFNDFNWTSGPGVEIGRPRAQQIAKSYYLAMLESQLGDWPILGEYVVRAPEHFRPPQAQAVVVTQHKRAPGDRKLVIDDFQSNPDPGLSSSGGAVTATVRNLAEAPLDDSNGQLTWTGTDPMNGMTWSHNDSDPARGIVFDWESGDDLSLEFEVPAAEQDLSDDAHLSFRAAQGTRHPATIENAGFASFSVALVDGDGEVSALDHRVFGGIPSPYPRTGSGSGQGWSNEFQTVRVPLTAFVADGRDLDLSNVVAIRFLFGGAWGSEVGRIALDDIEILGEGVR